MAAVLAQPSTVSCANKGLVQTVDSPKLTVSGSQVLVESGIANQPISGCTIPDNPPSDAPSTLAVKVNDPPSLAKKLSVGGNPVVLASLTGTANRSVPSLLTAKVTQTLLTTT